MKPLITDPIVVARYVAGYQWILLHPELHRQDIWAAKLAQEPKGTDCGTGMCYAGTTVMLAGARFLFDQGYTTSRCIDADGNGHDIATYAARLLGVGPDAMDALEYALFDANNTADDIRHWVLIITGVDPEHPELGTGHGLTPPASWMRENRSRIDDLTTALAVQHAAT